MNLRNLAIHIWPFHSPSKVSGLMHSNVAHANFEFSPGRQFVLKAREVPRVQSHVCNVPELSDRYANQPLVSRWTFVRGPDGKPRLSLQWKSANQSK